MTEDRSEGGRGGAGGALTVAAAAPESKAATLVKAGLFHVEIAAWVLAAVLALAGALGWAAACAAFALVADVVGRRWSRRSPVPMPYFMRWVLHLPRGPQSPAALARVLQPRPGERLLEIGPGIMPSYATMADEEPEKFRDLVAFLSSLNGEEEASSGEVGVAGSGSVENSGGNPAVVEPDAGSSADGAGATTGSGETP